jgi:hypothetical protein
MYTYMYRAQQVLLGHAYVLCVLLNWGTPATNTHNNREMELTVTYEIGKSIWCPHGACFWIFQKPSNIFEKNIYVLQTTSTTNMQIFNEKYLVFRAQQKKTNMEIFRNMGAHSKLHYSWPDLQFYLFVEARIQDISTWLLARE